MLISRVVTLFLLPSGSAFSFLGLLPLSFQESIFGAVFGYTLLWGTARIFYFFTGKEGLGQGDVELLAFIGAYTGAMGCWITLIVGSLTGSIIGIVHFFMTRSKKIPFGPFLAFGAMIYVLLKPLMLRLFLGL